MLSSRSGLGLRTEYFCSCFEDRGEAEKGGVVVNGSEMGIDPMMGLLDCGWVAGRQTNLLQTVSCELDRIKDVLGF
jgi:hypothetical protein